MMLYSKIQKIQSCEHIQVPGSLDKWGPTVTGKKKDWYQVMAK